MAVPHTSDVMRWCVFLLCAGLHFTSGCTEDLSFISCSPGESVLLQCLDESPQDEHIQWWNSDIDKSLKPVDVIKDQRYKDRVQIHRNLSLSITHLTVDDSGSYWCNVAKNVHLIIEGCSISGTETISRYPAVHQSEGTERKKRPRVMAVPHTSDVMRWCVFLLCAGLHFTSGCTEDLSFVSCSPGESVLLHCLDESPQDEHIQWWNSDFEESLKPVDVIKDQRYKDRVQIHRNLSLSITHLTVDDSGLYWCDVAKHVYLIIEGCSISGTETISRYPGESVFLSCSVKCSGRHKPDTFRWKLPNYREVNQTTTSTELSRLYQGRFHMFDVHSGNLSLLISNLTEKDEGLYVCWINENQHKNFSLTVKGCTLSETKREPETKYPGDSVLLSCSCKDSKTKPEGFKWTHIDSNGTEIFNETVHDRDRVHMFYKMTPSNLSLLISNLTEDDQGIYRCTVNNKTSTYTNLTVKGCVLSEHPITKIAYAGESVTLPCSCKDPKTKPNHVDWKRAASNESLLSVAKDVTGRFQILRDPLHNLSLWISNLTEADGGLYVCMVNGKQSISINLTVTDFSILTYSLLSVICLMLLLVTGFICWRSTRAKQGRRGSRVSQSPDHQADVTYSTVRQVNRGKPAENQQQADVTYSTVRKVNRGKPTENQQQEGVVYSTMADVRNGRSAQDDVIYSSVVSKSHKPRPLQMNTEETVYASVQKDQM